ncbi:MAG: YchJ family protein [Candidatus Binatia bacterium]|nr:YchJ family protein [Candidatus Binatia bacterium]
MILCPCGSEAGLDDCCAPAIEGRQAAPTAEALMRSRYTAHATRATGYLKATHVPPRDQADRSGRETDPHSTWTRLQIVDTEAGGKEDETGVVEFRAHYRAASGEAGVLHERSRFRKADGRWVYVDGDLVVPAPVKAAPKRGRNDPCNCGSGKKFKRCCGV